MGGFVKRVKPKKPLDIGSRMCSLCPDAAKYHAVPKTGKLPTGKNADSKHWYCPKCWEDECRRAARGNQ